MTYDLVFVRREPGQSWEAALDEAEQRESVGGPAPEVWQRVVDRAATVLGGGFSADATHDSGEIEDESSGIQLSLFASEASISGPAAAREQLVLLGKLLSEETGLEGFDPQTGLPL